VLMSERNRLFSIGSFNNDVKAGPFKEVPQTPADRPIVISEHDSQHHRRFERVPLLRSWGGTLPQPSDLLTE